MTAATNPDLLASDFRQLVEISLWGNRGDLSLSAGTVEVRQQRISDYITMVSQENATRFDKVYIINFVCP